MICPHCGKHFTTPKPNGNPMGAPSRRVLETIVQMNPGDTITAQDLSGEFFKRQINNSLLYMRQLGLLEHVERGIYRKPAK